VERGTSHCSIRKVGNMMHTTMAAKGIALELLRRRSLTDSVTEEHRQDFHTENLVLTNLINLIGILDFYFCKPK